MQLLAREVSAVHYTGPPGIVSPLMLTITYIQAMTPHIHAYAGYVQQPYSTYYLHDTGHGISVVGVMKMGNIVPNAGIEPTSLAS